ncbi:MAG: ABC transporter permease [Elusimicrobiota bacterium]
MGGGEAAAGAALAGTKAAPIMIQLKDVHKAYQMGEMTVHALKGVTLTIQEGEFVAIMGPSGSGKSTLMHVLGLLDVPDSGVYSLHGREVSDLSEDELAALRGKTLGFIFQQFNLLARTSSLENVSLPLIYSDNGHDPGRPGKLLEDVGLGDRLEHKPNELSGGQQQRVAIARSLINQPRVLFADEPTGNLDSKSGTEIMALLKRLNAQGITVVIVTHDPEVGKQARRIIRMRDGEVQSDETVDAAAPAPASPVEPAGPAAPLQRRKLSLAASLRESMAHLRQAIRALLSNKVRTLLSMLGILIGVAAVVAMLALGTGAQRSIEKQLASMGSNLLSVRPGSRRSGGVSSESGAGTRLTPDDAAAIAKLDGVRYVCPTVSGRGQVVFGNKNWSTQVEGVTPEYAAMRASEPEIGRFFTADENRRRARVAVLGMTLVRELFDGRNPIGESIKLNRISFLVVGIMPEKGSSGFRDRDDTIAIPLNTAMRRVLGKKYVDGIDIEARSAEDLESVQAAAEQLLIKTHRVPPARQEGAFRIRNYAEIQEAVSSTSKTMGTLLASIAAISLLVGGIGIMNIMLVSVTERTREIGLRKAVGASRRDILMQFLIEAVVISLAGGVSGVLLGWSITFAMSKLAGWAAVVSPASVILAVAFSGGVGIVFGLWPARKAASLHPIDALRYE